LYYLRLTHNIASPQNPRSTPNGYQYPAFTQEIVHGYKNEKDQRSRDQLVFVGFGMMKETLMRT